MVQILIAAKSGPVRRALGGMLKGQGYELTEAADGGEALCFLNRMQVDLLLTDLHMPVMDGVALSLAAKQARPRLKVLMMSEDLTIERKLSALGVTMDGIIQKPFNGQDLTSEIARLLPGRLRAA